MAPELSPEDKLAAETKYSSLLEHLDVFHNLDRKLGRMYAVLDSQGMLRCASKDLCGVLGVSQKDAVRPLREFLSTDFYEEGLRHVAFWADRSKNVKPDDIPKERAILEKEYARMKQKFSIERRLTEFAKMQKTFKDVRAQEFEFPYQLRLKGKAPFNVDVTATMVKDARREYAGTILAFAPYKEKTPWYKRVWNKFMDFETYTVTDEELLVVRSLESVTDAEAYMNRVFTHMNTQLLARHTKQSTKKLVINLRDVPETVKTDYVKMLFNFVGEFSAQDLIIGNPNSTVHAAIKKYVSPVPLVRSLLYRYQGTQSIPELEQFIEGAISDLRVRSHDANIIPNASVQPDVNDSPRASLDVLADFESPEQQS